ncbi:MAG: hypothetical protein OET79_05060 [Nitrospirota bacterium]|nr:hypothetical protein [Nitrospirota bacterium]
MVLESTLAAALNTASRRWSRTLAHLAKGGEKICALWRTGHRKIDMGIEHRLGNPGNP